MSPQYMGTQLRDRFSAATPAPSSAFVTAQLDQLTVTLPEVPRSALRADPTP